MKRAVFCLSFIILSAAVFAQNLNPAPGFVRINGGTFNMGSLESDDVNFDEIPQHRVTVSSFQMSRYPVTRREYREVMGANAGFFEGDNSPVEGVSWFDAIEYCNRRSQREGLTPAYTISGSGNNITVTWNRNTNGYRLPTEAEWEYACRAGTTTAYNTGARITTNQANYEWENSRPTPVNRYPANRWGLYDIHGNVWEWCWDLWGEYTSEPKTNPIGPASNQGSDGDLRIIRGGGWDSSEMNIRSAIRGSAVPTSRDDNIGFRIVRP
ncbi:MAG: formylglycine-generating enzyme family protein [Treponema sp.]|nr:formylglycine-generating enzyme family protein [Treponema sp.]